VVLNHDPVLLRTFLVHQPQHTLFSELVMGIITRPVLKIGTWVLYVHEGVKLGLGFVEGIKLTIGNKHQTEQYSGKHTGSRDVDSK
jgi:hypothetical protein